MSDPVASDLPNHVPPIRMWIPYAAGRVQSLGQLCCFAVLISVLFLPPMLPGYRLRLDHLVLLAGPFLLTLGSGRLDSRHDLYLLVALAALACGLILPTLLQFGLGISANPVLLVPAISAVKYFMIALLCTCFINSPMALRVLVKVVAVAIIFHGAMAWLQYTTHAAFVEKLMHLYGSAEHVVGHRAIGLFDKVHSLAFFLVYGIVFLAIMRSLDRRAIPTSLFFGAILFGLLGIAVSLSRAAYLMIALTLLYIAAYSRYWERLLIGAALIAAFFAAIYFGVELHKLATRANDLITALAYLDSSDQFVAGRLNHGIRNAGEVFAQNPIIGSLADSSQTFVGDNGYFSCLANYGLLGLTGWFAWMAATGWLFWVLAQRKWCSYRAPLGIGLFYLVLLIGATATQPFTERAVDLLPVYVIAFSKWSVACGPQHLRYRPVAYAASQLA